MISKRDLHYLEQYKERVVKGCSKCQGTLYDCDCYKDFRLEIKKVKANIPPKYRNNSLDDISHEDVKQAKEAVREYIQNIDKYYDQGVGLYLFGTSGLGKTLLSSIILVEVLKRGYTGYFTDLSQCISMLLEGWYDETKRVDFIDRLIECDFLVIDDVGREYQAASGINETAFDTVFRERANRMLPIIITSNKRREEIEMEYGGRIISLFYEHLISVEFRGTDFRKGIMEKKKKESKR